jgi:hypothetical protein
MVRYFAKGLPKFVLVVVNCSRGFKTLYTIVLKNITVLSGIVNVLLVSTNFGHHYLIPAYGSVAYSHHMVVPCRPFENVRNERHRRQRPCGSFAEHPALTKVRQPPSIEIGRVGKTSTRLQQCTICTLSASAMT